MKVKVERANIYISTKVRNSFSGSEMYEKLEAAYGEGNTLSLWQVRAYKGNQKHSEKLMILN